MECIHIGQTLTSASLTCLYPDETWNLGWNQYDESAQELWGYFGWTANSWNNDISVIKYKSNYTMKSIS